MKLPRATATAVPGGDGGAATGRGGSTTAAASSMDKDGDDDEDVVLVSDAPRSLHLNHAVESLWMQPPPPPSSSFSSSSSSSSSSNAINTNNKDYDNDVNDNDNLYRDHHDHRYINPTHLNPTLPGPYPGPDFRASVVFDDSLRSGDTALYNHSLPLLAQVD